VDSSQEFGRGDEFVLEELRKTDTPLIVALNKIDLVKKAKLLPLIDIYDKARNFEAIVPVCALHGDGIDFLEEKVMSVLPEAPPVFSEDTLTDQPEEALAAEIIREKVFLNTRREIPFCSAVLIDAFEDEDNLLAIAATILIERSSQKGIVIGKGGSMLKKIGTEARRELEELLNIKVYLELLVKVRSGWREDDRTLRELGIE
jgi:GTP-binding protein Era